MMRATGLKILSEVVVTLATVAFAMTGVLAVRADRDIDLIGALVLGLITAIHWNLGMPAFARLKGK